MKHFPLGCLLVVGSIASSGAIAQTIVVSDATNGLPHQLLEFTPGAAPIGPLGVLQGPWAPTFDFVDADTAYFLARSPDAPGATPFDGLYRFDAQSGLSSPVLTLDTSLEAFGTGSIAHHNGTVYWLARQADARESTLYAFEGVDTDAPTLRRIGDTGVRDLAGLAVNPQTGQLFTLRDVHDQFDEFIVWAEVRTLDTLTGAATFVADAPSLSGLTLGGGMDYSPDGSHILLARNFEGASPDDFVILDAFNPLNGTIVFSPTDLTRSGGILLGDIAYRVPSPVSGVALGVMGVVALARRRR
ncbi:MAG: hypothetical protein KF684_09750 [Phycisphaeraceae bacterium]|nr:hypothetical protein [Phycisphaeraceae bacterium]